MRTQRRRVRRIGGRPEDDDHYREHEHEQRQTEGNSERDMTGERGIIVLYIASASMSNRQL